MTPQPILLQQLTDLFREVLDNNTLALQVDTTAADVAEWDSVTHLILLHAIQDRFGVVFLLEEMMRFRNVGDICEAIHQHQLHAGS